MVAANTFRELMLEFDVQNKEHSAALRKFVLQYPYFQPAYAFYVKALKVQKDITFDRHLGKLAAITPDRRTLELFLEQEFESFSENESPEIDIIETPQVEERPTVKLENKAADEKTPQSQEQLTTKDVQSTKAKRKFSAWLKHTQTKPASDTNILDEQLRTIDNFLAKNPSIPRAQKSTSDQEDLSLQNNFDSQELMTETLAKVFVKQQKYEQALSAYRVLGLKYPEKSTFFADQIKNIKRLQSEK